MLTAYQRTLIDRLPVEGQPHYMKNGVAVPYAEQDIQELAELPLQYARSSANKRAIILHGAPGAGKTHAGMERLKALVGDDRKKEATYAVISYDEHGAIYDIPEYNTALQDLARSAKLDQVGQETPVTDIPLEARQQLWLDFQPLSQRIRSVTLKQALHNGQNLYVDTTSSSKGVLMLIDTLRDLDYKEIEIWSYCSPFEIAQDRIEQRLRPTSPDDLFKKRAGAYEMLPALIKYADRVSITVNDSNFIAPEEFARYENAQYVWGRPDLAESVLCRLVDERGRYHDAAIEQYGPTEGDALRKAYMAALQATEVALTDCLDSLQPRHPQEMGFDI